MNIRQTCKILTIVVAIFLILGPLVSCVPPYWDSSFGWSPFVGFPFGLVSLGLYFLPTILAAVRHKRNILGVVLLNVFAGWTIIGWIIALVWSLTGDSQ